MSPVKTLWATGFVAACLAAGFAWFARLPLPFSGFAALAAAALAFLGTLALVAWAPPRWVWSDAEWLRHAFQARHGVSDFAAGSALDAITTTHQRAGTLRRAASAMRDDIAAQVEALSDRLDASAREIFYTPERHRDLRAVLIRSELIEDAANAHARLRQRNHTATEDQSRQKLVAAIDAMNAAFDQTDFLAARGLLAEVEVASDVAEAVLKPRRNLRI